MFNLSTQVLQTFLFIKLAVAGHLTIFVTRTKKPFWHKPRPSASLLWSAVATKAAAVIIAVLGLGILAPVPIWLAAFMLIYCFAWFVINDMVKIFVLNVLKGKSYKKARKAF